MHTRFAYNAISVAGRRPKNEDSWGAHWYGERLFCAVADGIGGHPAGDVASSMAVHAAKQVVTRMLAADSPGSCLHPPTPSPECAAILLDAHAFADATVKEQATGSRRGMGTTLTTALFHNGCLTACNSGDSRCSVVRDGSLIPVTRDHSFVQEQIDTGIVRPDEAFGHPQKHIITRSIGSAFAADVTETPVFPGDTVILSTDGMHDFLTPEQIVQEVQGKTAAVAVKALLTAAVPLSDDNITICVVTVSDR